MTAALCSLHPAVGQAQQQPLVHVLPEQQVRFCEQAGKR